jgi:DNA-binding transcriptional ArsR family regulator
VSRPAISKHLRCLREAGLVSEERQGRRRIYRLQALALLEVRAWVDGFAPSADSAAVAGSTRRRARGRAAAGSSAKPGGWRVW